MPDPYFAAMLVFTGVVLAAGAVLLAIDEAMPYPWEPQCRHRGER